MKRGLRVELRPVVAEGVAGAPRPPRREQVAGRVPHHRTALGSRSDCCRRRQQHLRVRLPAESGVAALQPRPAQCHSAVHRALTVKRLQRGRGASRTTTAPINPAPWPPGPSTWSCDPSSGIQPARNRHAPMRDTAHGGHCTDRRSCDERMLGSGVLQCKRRRWGMEAGVMQGGGGGGGGGVSLDCTQRGEL